MTEQWLKWMPNAWCGGHFLLHETALRETLACPHCKASRVRSKVYTACVCSSMVHGNETWGSNVFDLQQISYQRSRQNTLRITSPEIWHWGYYGCLLQSAAQMIWACTACHVLYQICHILRDSWHQRVRNAKKGVVRMGDEWCERMWPVWHWPARQEMHGELLLNVAWCCQLHGTGHRQQLNIKWIRIDDMDGSNLFHISTTSALWAIDITIYQL